MDSVAVLELPRRRYKSSAPIENPVPLGDRCMMVQLVALFLTGSFACWDLWSPRPRADHAIGIPPRGLRGLRRPDGVRRVAGGYCPHAVGADKKWEIQVGQGYRQLAKSTPNSFDFGAYVAVHTSQLGVDHPLVCGDANSGTN